MSARGRLVTLEGVDGSGKSTHSAFVESLLRGAGHAVLRTREPAPVSLRLDRSGNDSQEGEPSKDSSPRSEETVKGQPPP